MNWQKVETLIRYYAVLPKIGGYREIDGWLTKCEAFGLYRYASLLPKDAVIVEIGTWKGKSTLCLAKGLRSGKIMSVDPFDASGEEGSAAAYNSRKGEKSLLEQFQLSMKKAGVSEKITAMKGFSSQFVGKFPVIDFLFIDGDHSVEGCSFDFREYAPFVRNHGYVAFHDYDDKRPDLGPTWVINNMVLKSSGYRCVGRYDSLWIAQKQ